MFLGWCAATRSSCTSLFWQQKKALRRTPFRGWLRHRRSRRHPASLPTAFRACLRPKPPTDVPRVFRETETVRPYGSRFQTVAFGLTLRRPQSRSKLAVFHADMTSLFPQTIHLAPGQDLRHDVSRKARGQLPTRTSIHKTSLFQCLAALCFNAFCPEDLLKLRPNPRFGKCGKSDLSTFPPMICGQWWTTQRFVALTETRPELCR